MVNRYSLIAACCIALTALAGCDDDQIHSYAVPKESSDQPALAWRIPPNWHQQSGQKPMVFATFETGQGNDRMEIAVSTTPGEGGGLPANVNRWRNQLGLPPATAEQMPQMVAPFQQGKIIGFVIDFTSQTPPLKRMVAVMLFDGSNSWFIKAMNRPDLIEQHKTEIVEFAQSFQFANQSQQDQQPNAAAPPGAHDQTSNVQWTAPDNWQEDATPSQFTSAAFNIAQNDLKGRVTVAVLGGQGGGMLMNINRWRESLGLPALADLKDQPMETIKAGDHADREAKVIDLLEPGNNPTRQHLVAVIMPVTNATFFFKLLGPEPLVAKERAALLKFVQSVRLMGGVQ